MLILKKLQTEPSKIGHIFQTQCVDNYLCYFKSFPRLLSPVPAISVIIQQYYYYYKWWNVEQKQTRLTPPDTESPTFNNSGQCV